MYDYSTEQGGHYCPKREYALIDYFKKSVLLN